MNLTGQWVGSLKYGKEYKQYEGKELYFQFDLVQHGDEIAGTAADTGGAGTSPDPANILGKFIDNQINFLKQYESFHYIDKDGKSIVDKSTKGPKIKYTGIYDESDKSFSGTWTMRVKFLFLWFIPITLSSTGTWTMKRK